MLIQTACTCPPDSQSQLLAKVVNNQAALYALSTGINAAGIIAYGTHGTASATFARPSDTTQYAINDVVSNSTLASTLMRFANLARALGKGGYLTKARLVTDNKAFLAQMRLWLYTVNNPTVSADNAGFALNYSNRAIRIGYIDFPTLATEDSTNSNSASAIRSDDLRLEFTCDPASRDLYGLLETKTLVTPTSAQNFFVELAAEQN